MKKLTMMVVAAGALCVSGCLSLDDGFDPGVSEMLPPGIENVSVVVAPGRDLKSAVIVAATRRRWVPQEKDATTVRCTLIQRTHRVVVDVSILDECHYSIQAVESNIPARKVVIWIGNLQREIAKNALR